MLKLVLIGAVGYAVGYTTGAQQSSKVSEILTNVADKITESESLDKIAGALASTTQIKEDISKINEKLDRLLPPDTAGSGIVDEPTVIPPNSITEGE